MAGLARREERRRDSTPHWIGVQRGWEEVSDDPLLYLVSLPVHKLRTHALVIGKTGSGKTNLLHHLIAQDIIRGHSFCVLDLRGDLVAAALELCAGNVDPEKVKLFDLREKRTPMGFNPLAGGGEPYYRALNVLDVLQSESESWGVQLAETLRKALMLLSESEETITRIEDLFYDRHFLLSCLDRAETRSCVDFWQRFDSLSADKKNALASPVLNKVSLLLSTPTLRKILGHSAPVDLREHLDSPGSVTLMSLAVDETHAAGRMMGRMMLSSVCREVFSRVNVSESRRNPVRLYVDEFEHFGTQEFDDILAEGRRFGLSLVLAHQTLAQLSTKLRSMILNNVGTKFAMRTGREDGAALSRDLCGDPNYYDFTRLRVGEAVMWTNDGGAIEIEVNEPIVGDVGRQSDDAREMVREIYALNPQSESPRPTLRRYPEPEPEPRTERAVEPPPVYVGRKPEPAPKWQPKEYNGPDEAYFDTPADPPPRREPPSRPKQKKQTEPMPQPRTYEPTSPERAIVPAPRPKTPPSALPAKPVVKSDLEDWLCG